MNKNLITGLHHVTAMVTNPNRNLKTYTDDLGMRLVKVTVNYDAPDVYHFYMGTAKGEPGSVITFFPFDDMQQGSLGSGQLTYTAYSVPSGSLSWWEDRLGGLGYSTEPIFNRFGDQVLRFHDHDGLGVELVANNNDNRNGWTSNGIPAEYAIKGFSSVLLDSRNPASTREILEQLMEHRYVGTEGGVVRLEAGNGGHGTYVDIVGSDQRGRPGSGTVHHVAFRTPDDETQASFLTKLADMTGYRTDIKDRQYFHSIYFREAGGILFEVATDVPGFMTDESYETLGSGVRLPEWLEPQRDAIVKGLPKIEVFDR
jgi:glyoxalase family protein